VQPLFILPLNFFGVGYITVQRGYKPPEKLFVVRFISSDFFVLKKLFLLSLCFSVDNHIKT
jgi:hypothetical protein